MKRAPARLDLRLRILGAAATALALALVPTVVIADPFDGTLAGQVSNGTDGATVGAGDKLTLVQFNTTTQGITTQAQQALGPDGRFAFDGLDRDPSLLYNVLVEHAGVTYANAEPIRLDTEATRQADLVVFDTTGTDNALQFERLNVLVVGASGGMLQAIEMGSLLNTGDRTFAAGTASDQPAMEPLHLGVPSGAQNVHVQSGFSDEDATAGAGDLQIASPLYPGRQDFAVAFQVPYTGTEADLALQLPYPAARYTIYAPAGGLAISSGQLAAQAAVQLGGQTFTPYVAQDVAKDTRLEAHLSGLPPGGLGLAEKVWLGLGGLLILAGAGAVAFSLYTRRSRGPASTRKRTLADERRQLVGRLATLDEQFASGRIPAERYQTEREHHKRRLVGLTEALRNGSGAP